MTCDIVGRVSIGASWKKLHHLIAPEGRTVKPFKAKNSHFLYKNLPYGDNELQGGRMFNFLKKKPTTWIDQPVIDYLMSVSPAYAIYYTVNMGGKNLQLQFRNNEGKFLADIHESRVQSISIAYQHFFNEHSLGVYGRLTVADMPRVKEYVEKSTAIFKTKSPLNIRSLEHLQAELKKQIEGTLGVKHRPLFPDSEESEPDRNINLHINSIGPEARERLLRFLSRLDNDCVDVMLLMHINSATEEEICSTQTELDMLDMEEEEEERW
jgi:hypothetical protein